MMKESLTEFAQLENQLSEWEFIYERVTEQCNTDVSSILK